MKTKIVENLNFSYLTKIATHISSNYRLLKKMRKPRHPGHPKHFEVYMSITPVNIGEVGMAKLAYALLTQKTQQIKASKSRVKWKVFS